MSCPAGDNDMIGSGWLRVASSGVLGLLGTVGPDGDTGLSGNECVEPFVGGWVTVSSSGMLMSTDASITTSSRSRETGWLGDEDPRNVGADALDLPRVALVLRRDLEDTDECLDESTRKGQPEPDLLSRLRCSCL